MKKNYKLLLSIIIFVGGFFIIKESIRVKAIDKTPNMKATITAYEDGFEKQEITTYIGEEFDLLIKIDGGLITEQSIYTGGIYILEGIFLDVSNLTDFEIVSAKRKDEVGVFYELNWKNEKIQCGDLKYTNVAVNPTMEIKVTLKAKKSEIYNKDNKSLLKSFNLNYKDIKSDNQIKVDTTLGVANVVKGDLIINVNDYKAIDKTVNFNSEKSGNDLRIPSGTTIPMFYDIVPPDIEIIDITKETQNSKNLSRESIYIIESSSLDEVVEGKTIREILIESLENVTDKNIYLIIYDKSATVKNIDGRNKLSVEEAIEILKNEVVSNDGGNLSEALIKAQALINQEKNIDKNILLITSGNPYYYSQRDGKEIKTFDLKENDVKFDEEKSIENAKVIAKDIAGAQGNNKWTAINFGLKSENLVANEIIEILDGTALSEDEINITNILEKSNETIADIVVEYTIKANEKSGESKGVTVEAESKEGVVKRFFYKYNKKNDGKEEIVIINPTENYNTNPVEIGVKITKIEEGESEIVNLLNIIDVKYQYEILGKEGSKSKEIEVQHTGEMNVTAIELFESRVGLFNGKKTDVLNDDNVNIDNFKKSTIQYIGTGKDQIGDTNQVVGLSIDNYFSAGILISPNEDVEIKSVKIKSSELIENTDIKTETYAVYKLNNNKFDIYSDRTKDGNYILKKSETDEKAIYLVVVDFNILANDNSKTNKIAKVGIGVGVPSQPDVQDSLIGLNIRTTLKPEHY